MLTIKDAENWLLDEFEGHVMTNYSYKEVIGLLHEYFTEATKAVELEKERLSFRAPERSAEGDAVAFAEWVADERGDYVLKAQMLP